MAEERVKTSDLRAMLRARYEAPVYALFEEVPDATGGRAQTTADAIAIGLWASRGLEVLGFEIKASRSDWLREMRNPAKAEQIARFCDRWWLVAGPDVVKLEEVPEGWGLLVARGARGLVSLKEAPKLEPIPITRLFLAALCRRIHETQTATPEAVHEAAVKAAAEARAAERKRFETELEARLAHVDRQRADVAAFEAATGLYVHQRGRDLPAIGAVVRVVTSPLGAQNDLRIAAERARHALQELERAGAELEAARALFLARQPQGAPADAPDEHEIDPYHAVATEEESS